MIARIDFMFLSVILCAMCCECNNIYKDMRMCERERERSSYLFFFTNEKMCFVAKDLPERDWLSWCCLIYMYVYFVIRLRNEEI